MGEWELLLEVASGWVWVFYNSRVSVNVFFIREHDFNMIPTLFTTCLFAGLFTYLHRFIQLFTQVHSPICTGSFPSEFTCSIEHAGNAVLVWPG